MVGLNKGKWFQKMDWLSSSTLFWYDGMVGPLNPFIKGQWPDSDAFFDARLDKLWKSWVASYIIGDVPMIWLWWIN